MVTYRKFIQTFTPPKLSKAPKVDAIGSSGADTLCGLAALGGEGFEIANVPEPAPFGVRAPAARKIFDQRRAGTVEHGPGITRIWAEALARLDPDLPPADVPPLRWRQFIDDGRRFLSGPFSATAVALGWGSHDLFGCDCDRPFARLDQAGLLWLLNGEKLVAVSGATATIETQAGSRQTYRRRPGEPGRALAWELTATP